MRKACWTLAMVLLAVLPASAFAKKEKPDVKADNKAAFAEVAAKVEHEMQPGGRFRLATADERRTVDDRLADMTALFDKYDTVDKMDSNSRLALFNDQEKVNGILTRSDADRLVCEQVALVGTHITHAVCRTQGEIQQDRRDTQQTMDAFKKVPQYKGGH